MDGRTSERVYNQDIKIRPHPRPPHPPRSPYNQDIKIRPHVLNVAAMAGYSTREVATLLGMSAAHVRTLVRAGFAAPEREQGELRFGFQDVVLLRTAKGLCDAKIAPRRVRRVLDKLRRELPHGRPLTAVSIAASGNKLVVRDGVAPYNPENGQVLFDFDVATLARKVAPLSARKIKAAHRSAEEKTAADWFSLGSELEISSPAEARDAYRRAIELDPRHVEAHVNLGRLLHEASELAAARSHYLVALEHAPENVVAIFNLGVVLEDEGELDGAATAYRRALTVDAQFADAHFNLARLYEHSDKQRALRHLAAYRKLTEHK